MAKTKRLSWCQQQVMERITDQWVDVGKLGPCAGAAQIKGLVSRGLIEHRKKDPNSPIAHLEWITQGQVRKSPQGI